MISQVLGFTCLPMASNHSMNGRDGLDGWMDGLVWMNGRNGLDGWMDGYIG